MTADCTLLSFSVPAPRSNVAPPPPLENGLFVPTFLPVLEVQPSFLVAQFGPEILDRRAALPNLTPLQKDLPKSMLLQAFSGETSCL